MTEAESRGIALVTGGSRGIGRGIVLALARDGYDVAINFLSDQTSARELASQVAEMKRRAMIVQTDVTQSDQVSAMVAAVVENLGSPSLLVNNVGPFVMKSVYDSKEKDWMEMIDGNLTSAFFCAKAVLNHIRQTKGSIIFVGGPNAEQLRAAPNTGAYAIAKNGVVALAKTLAREEAKHGVRVNVVNPGFIDNGSQTPGDLEQQAEQVPLGRVGTPEDVAEAVSFLVSDRAAYITGAVLNVSGGLWV
jgi:3-oxoacyl-[acyl-carrier protein] reductase